MPTGKEKDKGRVKVEKEAGRENTPTADVVQDKTEVDAAAALSGAEREEPPDEKIAEFMRQIAQLRERMKHDPDEAGWDLDKLFLKADEVLPATFLPERQGAKPSQFLEFPDGTILYRSVKDYQGGHTSFITREELKPKAEAAVGVIDKVAADLEQRLKDLREIQETLRKAAVG